MKPRYGEPELLVAFEQREHVGVMDAVRRVDFHAEGEAEPLGVRQEPFHEVGGDRVLHAHGRESERVRGLQLGEHVLLELVVAEETFLVDSGVGVGAERRQLKSGIIHGAAEPGGEAVGQPGEALDALEPDHFEARAEVALPGDADEIPEAVLPGVEVRGEAVQRHAELRAGEGRGHVAGSFAGIVLE